MKKSELINKIHKLYPFLQAKQVSSIVELVFSTLTEGLAEKKRIEIRGFGSFSSKERKVQLKFSTQTESIELGDRNSVSFRLSKEVFQRLNAVDEQ